MKKKDFILIGVLLLIILISYLAISFFKKDGDYVVVRVNGVQVAKYSLSVDGDYELNGGTNVLRIENGQAFLIYANCPDHLCMNEGKIDKNWETITCLPNRLTITVYTSNEGDIDFVS
jgi:hypothetical protein